MGVLHNTARRKSGRLRLLVGDQHRLLKKGLQDIWEFLGLLTASETYKDYAGEFWRSIICGSTEGESHMKREFAFGPTSLGGPCLED